MESVQKEETQKDDARPCLIFFVDRPRLKWWDHIFRTRAGFRHCFLMRWDEWTQRYLMIDWRQYQTDIVLMFDFEVDMWVKQAAIGKTTVVSYTPDFQTLDAFPVKYCSNTLARYLGLGNRMILTPYGLYRTLRRAGGEIVYSWRQHEQQTPEEIGGANQAGTDADRAKSSINC